MRETNLSQTGDFGFVDRRIGGFGRREIDLRVEFKLDEVAKSSTNDGFDVCESSVDVIFRKRDGEMRESSREERVEGVISCLVTEGETTKVWSSTVTPTQKGMSFKLRKGKGRKQKLTGSNAKQEI